MEPDLPLQPGVGGTRRRLLIVDDEQKICAVLAEHFSLKGYEVRSVCRGEEAVLLAEAFHPHVVLLDLLMPGLSGADTLVQLKQSPAPPKVVIISAADHEDVVQGVLARGADFYVCKPLNLTELDHIVTGVCPALGNGGPAA